MTDRTLRDGDALVDLRFDDRGLLPVVCQDAGSGRVLMVAWANLDALRLSLARGQMHFWSRSRGELWHKGATSGSFLEVVSLHADCDGDTVLALVRPTGPACHTGDGSCFGEVGLDPTDVLDQIGAVIRERGRSGAQNSYTVQLLEDENLRLKKLGEETAELILALARGEHDQSAAEAADLVYHLLVALDAAGLSLDDVRGVLATRRR
jgi:phosphoribosyl-ATP pyrophosphohydrolase/phosphoribosyl-AMP cyclohydrolase